MQPAAHRGHGQYRGQTLIMFAVLSVVLVGFVALAIDVGYMLAERRATQNAADAAAMAVGKLMSQSGSVTRATAEAISAEYARMNLKAADQQNLEIDIPSLTSSQVEVKVTHDVQKFFLGAVYSGDWRASASAVAQIQPGLGNYALLALKSNKKGNAIFLNGDTTIVVRGEGASAMANGNIDGRGGPEFDVGGRIDATGEISDHPDWDAPGGIHEGVSLALDPLDGEPVPPKGSPQYTKDDVKDCSSKSGCTLNPGYYFDLGTISIKGIATLNPGLYYFERTALALQDSKSRIEGSEVLLYFTGDESKTFFDPKNGAVVLSAPSASPYGAQDGLTVWIANCSPFDSQGSEEFSISGIFYAPCSDVTLHGNPDGDVIRGQLIVGYLEVKGTSDVGVKYKKYVETAPPEPFLIQ